MSDPEVILFIEDDKSYAELLRRAVNRVGLTHRLVHFESADEAQRYLDGNDEGGRLAVPAVVLLDLNLPGLGGFEFLQWLRHHSRYPQLPVVVLTGSDDQEDVRKAYDLGANSFLIKPARSAEFSDIVKMIEGFWMKVGVVADEESCREAAPAQSVGVLV